MSEELVPFYERANIRPRELAELRARNALLEQALKDSKAGLEGLQKEADELTSRVQQLEQSINGKAEGGG